MKTQLAKPLLSMTNRQAHKKANTEWQQMSNKSGQEWIEKKSNDLSQKSQIISMTDKQN